ncbi:hypothetical protein GGF32_008341 [Allomyces javanicus]|nr:hypothetical protein GGF32_008341 [Allomyces javanicus]
MGCSAFPPPRRPPRDSAIAAGSSASDAWTLPVEQAAQIQPKVPLWRPLVPVPAPAGPLHDVNPDGTVDVALAAPWSALAEQATAVHAALPADFAALGVTPLDARADVPATPPAHDPVENAPASAPKLVGMSDPAIPARVVTDAVVVTEHVPLPAPVAADFVIRATGAATLDVPPTSVAMMGFAGAPLAENTALPVLDWSAAASGGTRVVRATAAATTTSALGGGFIVSGIYVPYWTITLLVCVLWIYWVLLVAKMGKRIIHKLLCIDVFHGMFVMARRRVCGNRLTKARDKARNAKRAKREKKKTKKEKKKEKKKAKKALRAELGNDVDMGQYAMAESMRAIPSAANMDAYLAAQASMMRAPAALSSSALAMGMAVPGAAMMPEVAQAMMLQQQQPGMTMPHNYTDMLAQSLEMGGTLSAGSSPRTGRRQQGGGKIMRKGMSSVV